MSNELSTNFGKPGSFIHVISTQTGELVCERKSRVQWYTGANKINCVHLLGQEWLSDVHSYTAPVFVYVNQSVSSGTSGPGVHPLSFVEFIKLRAPKSLFVTTCIATSLILNCIALMLGTDGSSINNNTCVHA